MVENKPTKTKKAISFNWPFFFAAMRTTGALLVGNSAIFLFTTKNYMQALWIFISGIVCLVAASSEIKEAPLDSSESK